MSGVEQVIVWMWFLPVVLYIVIPLCLGGCWLICSLVFPEIAHRQADAPQETEAIMPKMLVSCRPETALLS